MNPHQSPTTSVDTQGYANVRLPHKETKLCIIIDSKTPIIMKVPIEPERLTLGQFKAIASLQGNLYKFYFKSHDSEFGIVKEEVVDDDSYLPVDGDRIVAWVISNDTSQRSLFEAQSPYEGSSADNAGFSALSQAPKDDYRSSSEYFERESVYFSVQLQLDNYNFLGLTLVGPSDESGSTDKGIYVGEIAKNSVVERDGRIQVEDRIVEINGLNVRDMRSDDAVAAFRSYVERRGAINLLLERNLRSDVYNRGRFTLPRDYAPNRPNHPRLPDPPVCPVDELPIPVFDHDSLRMRPTPQRPDCARDTHSLPRSITPRSLYASNNFDEPSGNNSLNLRTDSRSVYEPSTPTCLRQFEVALHCGKDDMRTIYTALRNDTKSLDIKDREWLKVIIKDAFIGSNLVKWLSTNVYGFSHKREVKRYANQMLNLGFIRDPMASGTFSEKCYYTLS